jgi:hypothetical protein
MFFSFVWLCGAGFESDQHRQNTLLPQVQQPLQVVATRMSAASTVHRLLFIYNLITPPLPLWFFD